MVSGNLVVSNSNSMALAPSTSVFMVNGLNQLLKTDLQLQKTITLSGLISARITSLIKQIMQNLLLKMVGSAVTCSQNSKLMARLYANAKITTMLMQLINIVMIEMI